jgi:spore germination protein YaaH
MVGPREACGGSANRTACYGRSMGRAVTPRIAALGLALIVGLGALGLYGAATLLGSPVPTGSQIAGGSASPTGPLASVPPTPLATPAGPPRVRALAAREIFGFLPYWKMGKPETRLPLDQLTTIAIFGVEAGRDGKLVRQTAAGGEPQGWTAWNSTSTDEIIRNAHAKDVRVVLTVQRFAWSDAQARRTVALLSDPAKRTSLSGDIVGEVMRRKADGANLDFEPVPVEVRPQYLLFMRELRAALDAAKPGLQLTFDVTTGVDQWDLAALTADDAADAALIMGYDYRVATATIAGSVDPLESLSLGGLRSTLEGALSQAAADRIILALPWYGRAWSTDSDQFGAGTLDQQTFGGSTTVEYADAVARAIENGRQWEPISASAWTVYRFRNCAGCAETWRQLWYDDVDSMLLKQDLVMEHQLRGLGVWALGYDQALPEAWATIRLTFGSRADSISPHGSAQVDPQAITRKHGDLPVVEGTLKLALDAADDAVGTGVAFTRVSAWPEALAEDGSLVDGITFPATAALSIDVGDVRLGPGFGRGESVVYVQWRDVAGNWSVPVRLPFWSPVAVLQSPAPLPSAGG